jgi:hypothetical protein
MRRHRSAFSLFVLATLTAVLLPGSAHGQSDFARPSGEAIPTPVGKIVHISGSVRVEHTIPVVVPASLHRDGGVTAMKVGDSVYSGDVIQTGPDSKAGIVFADGTAFNVSSNARMILNEFIYDSNGRSNSALLTLTRGAFTFVAGKVAKSGKMEIDTPVATMGIRGTTPRVEFRDDGSVAFSTLIEEKRIPTQQTGGSIRERTSATPVDDRRTRGRSRARNADGGSDTVDFKLRICRGC